MILVGCYGMTTGNSIWISSAPLLVAAILLRILTPSATHLKSIGWSLLAVNLAAAVLQVGLWHYVR
jgi:hypothetical protein